MSVTLTNRRRLLILFLFVILYVCLCMVEWFPGQTVVQKMGLNVFGRKDPLWAEIPPHSVRLKLEARDVRVNIYNLTVQGYSVSFIETPAVYRSPHSRDVILLHGTSSTAKDWEQMGTLQLLATWGHRGIALDLPGYGKSTRDVVLPDKRPDFLNSLLSQLQTTQPVIVAPSVSALYVIPYVKANPNKIAAVVGISASFPNNYDIQDLKQIQETKMLIIYGEKDIFGKKTADVFENIPNSQVRMVVAAGSQPHLEQPETFHRILYNFLKHITDVR